MDGVALRSTCANVVWLQGRSDWRGFVRVWVWQLRRWIQTTIRLELVVGESVMRVVRWWMT